MRLFTQFARTAALILVVVVFVPTSEVSAADNVAVQQAIDRGAAFLRSKVSAEPAGDDALTALAMLKAGDSADSREIQAVVSAIRAKIDDGVYEPEAHHIYEAGVDATLLSDVANAIDEGQGDLYQVELTAIAEYLISSQRSNGGWDYPSRQGSVGDTSVVQYAMLGLWAAARRGIAVNPVVWQRSISWHIANQNPDGGFRYRPGLDPSESTLNMAINAIGSTYIAMMHLAPGDLPDVTDPRIARANRQEEAGSTSIGPLEQVNLDRVANVPENPAVTPAEIPGNTAQMVTRCYNWIVPRFGAVNNTPHFKGYYYYSLERMAALTAIEQIGNASWFDVCANRLIRDQKDDGSWEMTSAQFAGTTRDTCFAVLFLTRSTAKILGTFEPPNPIGGGLMSGGRLPDGDLSSFRVDGTGVLVQAQRPWSS